MRRSVRAGRAAVACETQSGDRIEHYRPPSAPQDIGELLQQSESIRGEIWNMAQHRNLMLHHLDMMQLMQRLQLAIPALPESRPGCASGKGR